MKTKIKLLLAVFTLAAFTNALPENPGLDLGVLIVTPAGITSGVEGLPFSVSVIGRQEIERENMFSYSRVLDSVEGVHIHRTGEFGRSDISVRGLGDRGRKVMVLVDGRPTKMGLFGCTITQSLPVDNIQRVEVIRGPASVLYGSDAMGGAVNIVTQKARKKGFRTELRSALGSFNTRELRLTHGGSTGRHSYLVTAGGACSDGFRDNSSYNSENYSIRFNSIVTDSSKLGFNIRYYQGTKEEPALLGEDPALADRWETYKRGAAEIDYELTTENSLIGLKAYRNFGDHEFSDGYESTDFTNGLILNAVSRVFGNNRLISGAEFREQAGEFENNNFNKREYALYLLYEQRFSDRMSLFMGGRYNIDEVTDNVFTTHLGATFGLTERTRFRISRSEGFRSPQINDLYMYPPSNEDLKPETAVNYEIGVRHLITDKINLDITLYRTIGKDIIERVPNDTPPPLLIFQNTGDFEFTGAELGLNAALSEISGARLSYTYMDPGKHTAGRPGNKAVAKLFFTPGDLYLDIGGEFVSSYYAANNSEDKIDDFFIMRAKTSYDILENLRVFAGVENIFDISYSIYADLPGESGVYPMPGRSFTGGITYAF